MNFNKKYTPILLFIVSALFFVGFIARLTADFLVDYEWSSAPFYLYVIERFLQFIIPAIICLVVGYRIKKRTDDE